MIFPLAATSQSIDIRIVDDTGLPVTGLVAATFPMLTYSLAGANADVAFPALSDLALITTAYASGGVKERGNGVYRLDVPNGIFTTAGQVTIRGEATGKHVIVGVIEVGVSVQSVSGQGSGAFAVTVKVTSDGATPIVGAVVRISGAQSGLLTSDSSGNCAFSLNAGTVTLSIFAAGYTYPATIQTISGAATITVTMTAASTVTPSADPAFTNCYFTVRDAAGVRKSGVVFTFKLTNPNALTDAYTTVLQQTATSDVNGLVQITLPVSMTYTMVCAADGKVVSFTASTTPTFKLPNYVGNF